MTMGRCLDILQNCGVGEKALQLISRLRDTELVCRVIRRYGRPFRARRGIPPGGPLLPAISNLMVGAISQEWV